MDQFRRFWDQSKALTVVCVVMLPVFVLSVAGIFLDPRTITGAPAWLKPAKFAISIALYAGTLAGIFQFITVQRRFVQRLGAITAAALAVEIVIIDLQAARGTTSHFNTSTPLDGVLFGVMGLAILILWLASVGICFALFRQPFADRAWGWSLRLGMLITVIGSMAGGIMVHYGAHTVGAGDLRIPHFLGLHGIQVVPLLYWLVIRKWRGAQIRLVAVTAASYFAFVSSLAMQALRGQSIIEPDGLTLAVWAVWLFLTVVAWLTVRFSQRTRMMPNAVSVS